jgi:hypothetical protein
MILFLNNNITRRSLLRSILTRTTIQNFRYKNEASKDLTKQFSYERKEKSHYGKLIDLKGYMDFLIYLCLGGGAYYVYKRNKKELNDINIEYKPLEDKYQQFFKLKLVTINNDQYTIPFDFLKKLKKFKELELREDDVWVCTYPKTGTTWVQEIVYLIKNDCNFNKAKETKIDERFPFFEVGFPSEKNLNNLESPRFIKTHLPIELLPNDINKKCKLIYVLRNPKDVCVSYFNFSKMVTQISFNGNFDDFTELFLNGYVPYGSYANHINSYLNEKLENIHFIYYEDLHLKPKETIKNLCKFLGKELDDENIDKLIDWCSFTNMKNNKSVNYEWYKDYGLFKKDGEFYRQGKIGDWLNYFNPNTSIIFDKIIKAKLGSLESSFNYGISRDNIKQIHEEYLKKGPNQ